MCPFRRNVQDFCDSWSLTYIADALTFRGRSLVLRKEQRILAFLVLKITCSPARPLNPLIHSTDRCVIHSGVSRVIYSMRLHA